MRREDKRITDYKIIDSVLNEAEHCMISLSDNGRPYILPMNFGYNDNKLYLHSHPEGKKIEILKANNRVSFGVTIKTDVLRSKKPCNWGMKYMSVLGYGLANFLDEQKHKIEALDVIMEKYSVGKRFENFIYEEGVVDATTVIRVDIKSLTGKFSGFEI